jgi:hypothetical protein
LDGLKGNKRILKTILILVLILFSSFGAFGFSHAGPQIFSNTAKKEVTDSSDDYHLTREQFLARYGKDDTDRALINMVFRKRRFIPERDHAPGSGMYISSGESCVGLACAFGIQIFAEIFYYSIRAAINCSLYTREGLLSAIQGRELGYPIPARYARHLRPIDFR